MSEKMLVDAVYEDGALRPTEPLHLKDRQRVRLYVVVDTTDSNVYQESSTAERREVLSILVDAGLIEPKPDQPAPPDPVSPIERQRLADLMGGASGKPLSELVVEERGER